MIEQNQPPRLKLAEMWPDEGLGPLLDSPLPNPATLGRKLATPREDRPHCELCDGDLMRSRVRFYERPWVIWSKTRPYRCMDCGVRQWR
jgi:hypothetical protein